ncbi:MAG TPA: gfo/Idh/MocA family oxidoreductase, partial [Terriglobales bacterium]|nr:gfo/Idh/MocA family oxidoreductase [Terriglobales bacterium]
MNRREFIGTGAGVAALGSAVQTTLLSPRPLRAAARAVPPSDRVRFASIGTGVEGCTILQAALNCPGT